nr:hypothetical protein [Tanacetum cinerariifolium]
MKALKESRKTSRRQPGTRGSNKGIGSKPGVPNESTIVSATSGERTGTKPGAPHEENDDKVKDADDRGDDHVSNTHDDDDDVDDDETESDVDEIYKYKVHVRINEDERISDAEVAGSDKDEEEAIDAATAYAEKTQK